VKRNACPVKNNRYSPEEIGAILKDRFKVKAPGTGNELSDPFPFNLMFGACVRACVCERVMAFVFDIVSAALTSTGWGACA
jgi:hypothetical protein